MEEREKNYLLIVKNCLDDGLCELTDPKDVRNLSIEIRNCFYKGSGRKSFLKLSNEFSDLKLRKSFTKGTGTDRFTYFDISDFKRYNPNLKGYFDGIYTDVRFHYKVKDDREQEELDDILNTTFRFTIEQLQQDLKTYTHKVVKRIKIDREKYTIVLLSLNLIEEHKFSTNGKPRPKKENLIFDRKVQ